MERSTNNRNVSNYDELAKYYDELLQDEESLSIWLKYIEDEKFSSVLELASGSGVMAGILKNKGYKVIASDLSESMKEASKNNYDGDYRIINMINYDLNQKFDLILCICDSINYLEKEELDSFFECAYKHLNNNGRLIFDMHSMARLNEFKEQYIEEGYVLDTPYQWTIMSDPIDNLINEHFTFYTKDGMIQEHHTQNVFELDLIRNKMSNLFDTYIVSNFIEDEKVLVIGRKL